MNTDERGSRELVTYRIDDSEGMVESIITAFRSIDFETEKQRTVLNDWVNCDSLDELYWDRNDSLRVSTTVWTHPVTITRDAVTIYPATTET